MSDKTFEAATLEAALEQATTALGVGADEIEHEVVETKQDFWGGGGETVVVKAWKRAAAPEPVEEPATEPAEEPIAEEPAAEEETAAASEAVEAPAAAEEVPAATEAEEAPAEDETKSEEAPAEVEHAAEPAEAADEPVAPAPAKADAADGEDVGGEPGDVDPDDIKALLAQIFHDMEFDCTVEISADGDGFLAKVGGADQDAILEGNGRCLSALELIANNAFRHKLPRGSKVTVDSGDFRSRRDDELSDLAFQVAHSAKESGRTQETQPLNPYERRLVHLALADDSSVTTKSRGTGFLKNVQVIPSGGSRGRGRRGGRR